MYEYPACRHQVLSYPFQVWLLSVITVPLLGLIMMVVGESQHIESQVPLINRYVNILFSQVIFSIPSLLVYMLGFWLLAGLNLPSLVIKAFLALTGIGCFYMIFVLFPGNFIARVLENYLWLFSPVFILLSLALPLKKN
jgi:hypothetical protein